MKILLTNLPSESQVADNYTPRYVIDKFSAYPPLGLLYIATAVKPRHNLEVLDATARNFTIKKTIDYIASKKPELVGISTVTNRLYAMLEISKGLKMVLPKTKIVAGGPHTNIYPMETVKLGPVDFVLTGDAEESFTDLVEAVDAGRREDLGAIPNLYFRSQENGEIFMTKRREDAINLDTLPFPRRDLIDMSKYYTAADKKRMTTLNSSRGCPYRCIFCDVQSNTYRYRSAENIVREMELIAESGIREIHIFDDTFNIKRGRVIQMCEDIIRRRLSINWSARARVAPLDEEMISIMKRSGCYRLHLGVESSNPKILASCGKKITLEQINASFRLCNKYGIETLAYFIIGFPQETARDAMKTVDFVKKTRPTYMLVTSLYPLPNTVFYKELLEKRQYLKDHWLEFAKNPVADFKLPLWRTQKEEKEIQKTLDYLYTKFYISPFFIMRQIRETRSLKLAWIKFRLGLMLLKKWLLNL